MSVQFLVFELYVSQLQSNSHMFRYLTGYVICNVSKQSKFQRHGRCRSFLNFKSSS